MTKQEFLAEGERRFGSDQMTWKFICPACKHIQSVQDYMDAKAPETAVGFSCVGRWIEGSREAFGNGNGPCNYAGGGLFRLNPMIVDGKNYFEFA